MGGFLYLEPVISKIFPIHLLNCFTHACNIAVLQERVLRNTVHFLNVDILGKKKQSKTIGSQQQAEKDIQQRQLDLSGPFSSERHMAQQALFN